MTSIPYIINGTTYKIEPILSSKYVDVHCNILLKTDTLDEISEKYKEYMCKAIDESLAIQVIKDGNIIAWFYGTIENGLYWGRSIYSNDIVGTVLILSKVFNLCDKHKLSIRPHSVSNMLQFKSVIRGGSIRAWYNGNRVVSILREDIVSVGKKAFGYIGLKE